MSDRTGKLKLTVRREIQASAEELFDAWLDPASLAQWMCPGDAEYAEAQVDPRVGGAFRIVMHARDKSYVHTGTYRAIDRPRRLAFTWISSATRQTESLVTVDFNARFAGTEVVLTHEALPDDMAVEEHTRGWSEILELLDRQPFVVNRRSHA